MSDIPAPVSDKAPDAICPCGSGRRYGHCCGPLHQGEPATTAEELMRSRYSAFALQLADYLAASWHPQTRPQPLTLEPDTEWLGLTVLSAEEHQDQAKVHFSATFREGREFMCLTEVSNFVREQGRWFYVDGDARFETLKPGRNDECLCGSGKKFKKCCG